MTADPKQILIYLELPAGDPLAQIELLQSAIRMLQSFGKVDWEVIDSGVHK